MNKLISIKTAKAINTHTSQTFTPYQNISAYDIAVKLANFNANKQPTTMLGRPIE